MKLVSATGGMSNQSALMRVDGSTVATVSVSDGVAVISLLWGPSPHDNRMAESTRKNIGFSTVYNYVHAR